MSNETHCKKCFIIEMNAGSYQRIINWIKWNGVKIPIVSCDMGRRDNKKIFGEMYDTASVVVCHSNFQFWVWHIFLMLLYARIRASETTEWIFSNLTINPILQFKFKSAVSDGSTYAFVDRIHCTVILVWFRLKDERQSDLFWSGGLRLRMSIFGVYI